MIARWVWIVMMIGTGVEFALGVACLALVPIRRPDQWLPPQSKGVYVTHAVLGGLLAIGALAILVRSLGGSRFVRLGAQIGLVGLLLGAAGGMLSVSHAWRLTGIGLMFAGALVAFFGYVIPLADIPVLERPG
jgi:hypothetical protein